MKRIVLMGFMGAGKTTVGRLLGKTLSCEMIDTDDRIEKEQGKKISDIFAQNGEIKFRELETELLERLCESKETYVLSIGGGMPLKEENRALLRKIGAVIYLKTSKEEIIRRVSGDTKRPLLQGGDLETKVAGLMESREQIYIETAQKILITDGKTVKEIVKEICNIMDET